MCRFVVYVGPSITLGSLLTEPEHSLIHQSYHSKERVEPLNGDGFGVGWFVDGAPVVFRSMTPAWSNNNLHSLAAVTESACILAHVRAASPGLPTVETNCHPFTNGSLLFMHNGSIGGFRAVKRKLQSKLSDESFHAIQGSTDSEHVFALLLDELGHAPPSTVEALADALRAAIGSVVDAVTGAAVEDRTQLNLAVSDGRRVVVSRFTTDAQGRAETLYCHRGARYVCEGGVCRMIEPGSTDGAVLVSSEALSDDPGWEAVPPNHLVVIDEDRSVQITGY